VVTAPADEAVYDTQIDQKIDEKDVHSHD